MTRPYEPNPKHKHPWQPGRKGTLCNHGLDADEYSALEVALPELLDAATEYGAHLYAAHGGRAYKAQQDPNTRVWHGYPVPYKEVPEPVHRQWVAEGTIRRSDVQRYWVLEGA